VPQIVARVDGLALGKEQVLGAGATAKHPNFGFVPVDGPFPATCIEGRVGTGAVNRDRRLLFLAHALPGMQTRFPARTPGNSGRTGHCFPQKSSLGERHKLRHPDNLSTSSWTILVAYPILMTVQVRGLASERGPVWPHVDATRANYLDRPRDRSCRPERRGRS